ncbi:MAG: rhomboid family intramembrane serine protease, partial [Bacteroidota bacterium]
IIIALTIVVSLLAFNDNNLFKKLQLNPYLVIQRNQWHRVITHGFIHADSIHLLVNMIVLFSFGRSVENQFDILAKNHQIINSATLHMIILYFAGMIIASSTTIFKHKNNYQYNSVGASGAVSAVVFAAIFFSPKNTILIMGIIPIPAILFGILYLIYSQYKSRKGNDNVNHDAHFLGAVFGFIYPVIIDPSLLNYFLNSVF